MKTVTENKTSTDILQTTFGYFQDQGREFVVTEKNTPRALVNYFWNRCFISGISQHGGGEGVYKGRAIQYIDPKGRNLMIRDCHRYFYLRDNASGDVWSPGWHPVHNDVNDFKCTHGLGYSIIESSRNDVHCSMRVFVPSEDPCEIWTIMLENNGSEKVSLKFYSFADWYLMGYERYCDYFGMLFGEYYPDIYAAQGRNQAVEREHPVYDGFVASDLEPTGHETSQRAFLGNFGNVALPEAVSRGSLSDSRGSCENLCSVLEHTIELGSGDRKEFNIFIGASSGYEMTSDIVKKLKKPGMIEEEFGALKKKKQEMIDLVKVNTPNERVNYLINNWIKQQTQVYADVGSDNGRGFRDAIQLVWGTNSYDHEYSRHMLIECLSHQYASGATLRGWLPIDDHNYSDGPIWIAPVVDSYLRETGDYSFLDEKVPYYPEGEGTVWEHIYRSIEHNATDIGENGMTLMHFGDWNDSITGVGLQGKGESVWTAIATVFAAKKAASIAHRLRKNEKEEKQLLKWAQDLSDAINENAWDGEWYLRAINDWGEKIGTHSEKEGFIFLNPQIWAVMADICDEDRKKELFAVVDKYLETDTGSRTLYPAYTTYNERIGRLTALVPGMWENGTAYCHSNGFKIIADCYGGRGDAAYTSFLKAMPDSKWVPSTVSGCEPYVLTNQFLGPENPNPGRSPWAWMTGSGSWYYRAMTQYMIGVRAGYDGLVIDPCMPSEWDEVSLERSFRGARYKFVVKNPKGLQKGDLEITMDGEAVDGNVIPIQPEGTEHSIEIILK